ncbi:peptidoglycan D,D-transpeptidase FtsI family protein [Paenibacillus ginsengarvi]|uniref:Penicillin-binding protein 2 n=1 Tax=Paenibacillus ginsengarvi TaxID=400777 RepID=A0A3B0C6M7_9BACL|nr:penicillin-binding transpeptidase domain-containing protein [Paenibacillus ginsengarvi]RKN80730.1 penicillin-binding protein 2 [Paenibacillus ginsengarvi]
MAVSMEDPDKKELVRRRHFSFRLNFFFFCTFLLFSILIVRLALLQFVDGKRYSEEEANSTIIPHSIPPIRGSIFDRNNYPLATSVSTQSLYYTVDASNKDKDAIVALARKLEDAFRKNGDPAKAISAEEIIKLMDVGYDLNKNRTKEPSYYSIPRKIKGDLTQQEIAYFSWYRDEFKGVDIQEESIREYNDKHIAVQLVGYLKQFSGARNTNGLKFYQEKAKSTDPTEKYLDNEYVGFDGIEYMYQEELRGKNGVKSYPVNAEGKIVGGVSITKPEKGQNLYLTIDKDVQLTAQEAIVNHLQYIKNPARDRYTYAPNATTGYAVAMEVDTGNVVAMASMPDYDPNYWYGGLTDQEWNDIMLYYRNGTISDVPANWKDPKERAKHPSSLVYLGSTIKPLTVLIGLQEKLMTINETYYDNGFTTFGKDKTTIRNSDGRPWGKLNVISALAHSSNTYMTDMVGLRLYARPNGLETWDSYMKQFGLGVLTGSGLLGEKEGVLDYFHEAEKASTQSALARASWGQLGRYTPLQLVQYAAMLGNRGKRMKPQFVKKIETNDGQIVKEPDPEVLNEVNIPAEYWNAVQNGMELVNKQGFDGFPYTVATKTGTSTQSVAGKDVDNAVFIAYAPADKPKLAIAVVVPEGGFGSYGAAPIARKIFDAYDRSIGLTGVPNPNAGQQP